MTTIKIEEGKLYERQELINIGLKESKINAPNYAVFMQQNKYYLFKEMEGDKLILDYIGY